MKAVVVQFKYFMVGVLKDKIDDYEGTSSCGRKLGFNLLHGSYIYNAYESKQWVQEHFDELGEIVKEMTEEGFPPCNVFENPEVFQLQIMLFVAGDILSQCDTVSEFWDDEIVLEMDIIDKIKEELDNL